MWESLRVSLCFFLDGFGLKPILVVGLAGEALFIISHWALSHNTMCMLINDISGMTIL